MAPRIAAADKATTDLNICKIDQIGETIMREKKKEKRKEEGKYV